jgi:hypothetical protein
MWAHCVCPTDSLTWDDVCQLWDNGVYTAEDVKIIATLYFEGAELSAVQDVIEKVENESQTLEALSPDPWDYDIQPAPLNIDIGTFRCPEPKGMQNFLEPERNDPRHRLH